MYNRALLSLFLSLSLTPWSIVTGNSRTRVNIASLGITKEIKQRSSETPESVYSLGIEGSLLGAKPAVTVDFTTTPPTKIGDPIPLPKVSPPDISLTLPGLSALRLSKETTTSERTGMGEASKTTIPLFEAYIGPYGEAPRIGLLLAWIGMNSILGGAGERLFATTLTKSLEENRIAIKRVIEQDNQATLLRKNKLRALLPLPSRRESARYLLMSGAFTGAYKLLSSHLYPDDDLIFVDRMNKAYATAHSLAQKASKKVAEIPAGLTTGVTREDLLSPLGDLLTYIYRPHRPNIVGKDLFAKLWENCKREFTPACTAPAAAPQPEPRRAKPQTDALKQELYDLTIVPLGKTKDLAAEHLNPYKLPYKIPFWLNFYAGAKEGLLHREESHVPMDSSLKSAFASGITPGIRHMYHALTAPLANALTKGVQQGLQGVQDDIAQTFEEDISKPVAEKLTALAQDPVHTVQKGIDIAAENITNPAVSLNITGFLAPAARFALANHGSNEDRMALMNWARNSGFIGFLALTPEKILGRNSDIVSSTHRRILLTIAHFITTLYVIEALFFNYRERVINQLIENQGIYAPLIIETPQSQLAPLSASITRAARHPDISTVNLFFERLGGLIPRRYHPALKEKISLATQIAYAEPYGKQHTALLLPLLAFIYTRILRKAKKTDFGALAAHIIPTRT